ncbi:MAG TPA: hypothetical protein VGD60_05605 [Candidatus Acidoferrales bacterium]
MQITRKAKIPLLLAATLLALVFPPRPSVRAQNSATPDLSGTWKLNLARSTPPKNFNLKKETIVITCSGQKVEFRYGRWTSDAYTTDGKERPAQGTPASVFGERAEWQGGVLMTERIQYTTLPDHPDFKLPPDDKKTYWLLSDDRQTLLRKTDDPKGVLLYERVAK